jgi:hypothetical protein
LMYPLSLELPAATDVRTQISPGQSFR